VTFYDLTSNAIRCTSTGRVCDGYTQSTRDNLRKFEIIRPELTIRAISVHQVLDDNVQHLEFYHRCVGPSISTNFDQEFWSRTPLQLAQSELSIRHALISLSYLNKSETGTLKDARSGLVSTSKQKTMLVHYNKAVKHLAQRISEPSFSPEIGLVCCLLFICLEYLRGDHDTALAHLKSGLKIISAYKESKMLSSSKESSSNMIEDTLIPIFTRMIATAIIYGLPSEQVCFTSCYPIGTQKCTFRTVVEAESSMHNIRNISLLLTRKLGIATVLQEPQSKELLQEQNDCVENHHVWLRSMNKLERETTLSKRDSLTAHLLKAQHHFMYIFTELALPTNQTMFDAYLESFKAVIAHSRIVLDAREATTSPNPAANFTFEAGVIPGLYLTACRCRCPTTRREALSLLERNPPREGLWDAQQHAMVARRVIELEEREMDPLTGWPVERTRIWSTMIRGDMDGNGKFQVYFAIGHWGEGRGIGPLPPGMKLPHDERGRVWLEWFVL
jgi:hypothetical protein